MCHLSGCDSRQGCAPALRLLHLCGDGVRETTPALYLYDDGREVCRKNAAGRALYRQRTVDMVRRQDRRCCLEGYCPVCPGALREKYATFDHENGRGGGKQDDRITLPDGTLINGSCHLWCNSWKASRRIDYNREANGRRLHEQSRGTDTVGNPAMAGSRAYIGL